MELVLFILVFLVFLVARLFPSRLGQPAWWYWAGAIWAFLLSYFCLGRYADNGDWERGLAPINPWLEPAFWLLPAAGLGGYSPELSRGALRRPWRTIIVVLGMVVVLGGWEAIIPFAGLAGLWLLCELIPVLGPLLRWMRQQATGVVRRAWNYRV